MKKLLITIVLIAGCNATFQQKPSRCCPPPAPEPVAPVVEPAREVPPFQMTYNGEIQVIDRKIRYIWPDGTVQDIK